MGELRGLFLEPRTSFINGDSRLESCCPTSTVTTLPLSTNETFLAQLLKR